MSEPEQHNQEPGSTESQDSENKRLGESGTEQPANDELESIPVITMGLEATKLTQESRQQQSADKARIKDLLQRQRRIKAAPEESSRQLEMPLDRPDAGKDMRESRPPGQNPRRKIRKPQRMKAIPQKRLIKSKRHLDRARRRQMNYLQKRREQKKLRVFYGRIRSTFKFLFALMWGVLIWEAVHSPIWTLDAPRFSLVHQSSDYLLQPTQIEPLMKTQVGKPLFEIDPGKLANALKSKYDVIEHVAIRRLLFPTRLEVIVQEKKPWAELYPELELPTTTAAAKKPIKTPKKNPTEQKKQSEKQVATKPYALLSSHPEIINLAGYQYKADTYHDQGITKILVTPKKPLSKSFLAELETLAYQLQHIPGLHFRWLDVRNPNVVAAQFDETMVIIGRLDVEAPQRLSRLIPLIPKILEFKDVIEAVDLRWSQQITFRKKPNAVIKPPSEVKTDG